MNQTFNHETAQDMLYYDKTNCTLYWGEEAIVELPHKRHHDIKRVLECFEEEQWENNWIYDPTPPNVDAALPHLERVKRFLVRWNVRQQGNPIRLVLSPTWTDDQTETIVMEVVRS